MLQYLLLVNCFTYLDITAIYAGAGTHCPIEFRDVGRNLNELFYSWAYLSLLSDEAGLSIRGFDFGKMFFRTGVI